jgi:hypothetical protein
MTEQKNASGGRRLAGGMALIAIGVVIVVSGWGAYIFDTRIRTGSPLLLGTATFVGAAFAWVGVLLRRPSK